MQIYEKYSKSYMVACDSIATERARFSKELAKLPKVKVFPSQANYVLCKLNGETTAKKLTVKMLDKYNIFIKDLGGKRGFENGEYIRLAVRDKTDNDMLLAAFRQELLK